jgi:uncharacterized protein (TIGR02001 family)
LFSAGARADNVNIAWEVAWTSDYVDRGVSQSMGRPVLQAGASAGLDNGAYAWIWLSGIDYTHEGQPDDGAFVEIDTGLGYWHALGENAWVDVAWTRYTFPGTEPGVRYDYSEFSMVLGVSELTRLTLSASDNIYNSDATAWHALAESGVEFADGFTVDAGLGWFDLESAYGAAYAYGRVGLSRSWSPVTARLGFERSSDAAIGIFGDDIAGSRWVLTLAAEFD